VSKHWSPKRDAKVLPFSRPRRAPARGRRRRGLGIGRRDLLGMALAGLAIGGVAFFASAGEIAMPFGIGTEQADPAFVRVIDGDTFAYHGVRVRVADIDTPEVRGRCAFETRLAAMATARMRALLNEGAFELRPLASGRDEDRYGRKLRIVTRNGRSLGDQLVAEGLARTWSGRREPWC
jgi:endonuclease YncB( thermonuclease family)